MNQAESVFDREADRYDNWFENNKQIFKTELNALSHVIGIPEKGIEIGVGTGRFAAALGIHVGVDPSNPMLMYARESGLIVVQAVGERLPFLQGCFDLCLLTTTVCFLVDVELTFLELWRILRPGGRVVIGMIDAESWLGKRYRKRANESIFYSKAVFRTPRAIGEILKRKGFLSPSYFQTLFKRDKDSERIEVGYGYGGFVVICAEKSVC